jgi:hypothetical protein
MHKQRMDCGCGSPHPRHKVNYRRSGLTRQYLEGTLAKNLLCCSNWSIGVMEQWCNEELFTDEAGQLHRIE